MSNNCWCFLLFETVKYKRESLFLLQSSLSNHKNIVSYVDHMITQSRDGVYDYMLLTAFYRSKSIFCRK